MYGQLGKDNVFRKKVKTKNIMRKFDAWGLDLEEFNAIPEDAEIRLLDTENNMLYSIHHHEASIIKIVGEYGDHKPQVFIPRASFTQTKHEPVL